MASVCHSPESERRVGYRSSTFLDSTFNTRLVVYVQVVLAPLGFMPDRGRVTESSGAWFRRACSSPAREAGSEDTYSDIMAGQCFHALSVITFGIYWLLYLHLLALYESLVRKSGLENLPEGT